MIGTDVKIEVLHTKLSLIDAIDILGKFFGERKVIKVNPHVDSVKLGFLALDHLNFINGVGYIESLSVFPEFILSYLGEVKNVIN